jgi:phosphopantothenoylcysteine decarboxylase/phosphopantothenate--cysteine ligase
VTLALDRKLTMFAGREIVLGVTGGIAAYKAAMLASLLVQREAGVTAVLTRNARRFVGAATFAALTGRPVASRSFDPAAFPLGAHIELAARADLVVVAPASADFLAKAVDRLAADGLQIIQPKTGWLSCRQHGAGRMAEPDEIAAAIATALADRPRTRSS